MLWAPIGTSGREMAEPELDRNSSRHHFLRVVDTYAQTVETLEWVDEAGNVFLTWGFV